MATTKRDYAWLVQEDRVHGDIYLDPEIFEQEMERIFQTDLRNCRQLTREVWEARGVHRKFTEAFLAPLRPLL